MRRCSNRFISLPRHGRCAGPTRRPDPQKPRTCAFQVEARLPAHAGGVLTLDVRGDMVVTAGLGLRHGQPVVERAVRVFDLRSAPRLFASVRALSRQHVRICWHSWSPCEGWRACI